MKAPEARPATSLTAPQPFDGRAVAQGLALGAGGGVLFNLLDMPLSWMLGAMCLTTAASLAGVKVQVPGGVRTAMIAVLGVMLGSVFSPEVFDNLARWAHGLIALIAYVAIVAAFGVLYFMKVAGLDRVTAYFSAMPGGLSEMVLVGDALGGDGRTISLIHTVRILILVLVIPVYFRFVQGLDVPATAQTGGIAGLDMGDAAILIACGLAGFWLARRLKVPAAGLVGPMVLSAAIHLAGLTQSHPPAEIIAIAQIGVGAAIGCRFAGVSIRRVAHILRLGAGSAVLMLALTAALAWGVESLGGTSFFVMVLALAPGGLAEMSLIALALGADTVFVSTMHIVRIAIIITLAPFAYRLLPTR